MSKHLLAVVVAAGLAGTALGQNIPPPDPTPPPTATVVTTWTVGTLTITFYSDGRSVFTFPVSDPPGAKVSVILAWNGQVTIYGQAANGFGQGLGSFNGGSAVAIFDQLLNFIAAFTNTTLPQAPPPRPIMPPPNPPGGCGCPCSPPATCPPANPCPPTTCPPSNPG